MIWRFKKRPKNWTPWFAWRPVFVGEGLAWLQQVYRREASGYHNMEDIWEYSLTGKEENNG
jgi:hypothetical protein